MSLLDENSTIVELCRWVGHDLQRPYFEVVASELAFHGDKEFKETEFFAAHHFTTGLPYPDTLDEPTCFMRAAYGVYTTPIIAIPEGKEALKKIADNDLAIA